MKHQDYINEFHKFLRENNAISSFHNGVVNRDKRWKENELTNLEPKQFIQRMFTGEDTLGGYDYWGRLHDKWQLRLKELQSPERIADAGKTINDMSKIGKAIGYLTSLGKQEQLEWNDFDGGDEWKKVINYHHLITLLANRKEIRVKPKKLRPLTGEEWLKKSNNVIIAPNEEQYEVFAVRLNEMGEPLVILRHIDKDSKTQFTYKSDELTDWVSWYDDSPCGVEE